MSSVVLSNVKHLRFVRLAISNVRLALSNTRPDAVACERRGFCSPTVLNTGKKLYAPPRSNPNSEPIQRSSATVAAPQDPAELYFQPAEANWVMPEDDVETYTLREMDKLRYEGDGSFLAGTTVRTKLILEEYNRLLAEEVKSGGCLDVDVSVISDVDAFAPGYIKKDHELIVGLQTDQPLKRSVKPKGGINMIHSALKALGKTLDPKIEETFTKYCKTHNEAVFQIYPRDVLAARNAKILTGLPDAYGRGRIIGDYRRVALFGVDKLIKDKIADKLALDTADFTEDTMRLREELSEQIIALNKLKNMASSYCIDISKPATTAHEAIQWLYFGYLGSVKEQDGAAMSIGRIDTFLDSYIQRDLDAGVLTEEKAQELIDDFVIKLRMVRHLRTPEYNDLFAGDPTWVTVSLAGIMPDGKHGVTKTSFRIVHTLFNLGYAAEPNITVLWAKDLPTGFRKFCMSTSIASSCVQYENDDLMRPIFGSDYGIACCVSAMKVGKQMQFFGARCNMPKLLLYAINEGRDENSGKQVMPKTLIPPMPAGPIKFDDVCSRFDIAMDWMAKTYVTANNAIHYSHDKYNYESLQMALHDTKLHRFMAFGMSGISIVSDSLAAIRDSTVTAVRDERGLTTAFETIGASSTFGNDMDNVDDLAKDVVHKFITKLRSHKTYRESEHTLSLLTITSNVVYGSNTGATPDGRLSGEPFAPGANPMHGRDCTGAIASLNSVAKMSYDDCKDGISLTFSTAPTTLGKTEQARVNNLESLLDGYFSQGAHHLNVNVLNRDTLVDAMDHPEKYPNLCLRVSGYAVMFNKLNRKQQQEVISRTFHLSL